MQPWRELTFDQRMERLRFPDNIRSEIKAWLDEGTYPGKLLTAILEDDLSQTILLASPDDWRRVDAYVGFFRDFAPRACWGSKERMAKWSRQRFHERATYGGIAPKITE